MNSTAWIITPKKSHKAKFRLFCFPYSGGAASVYYPWANMFPDLIEVCTVQYPGHGTRISEKLCYQLNELIKLALPAFLPYLDMPFGFFGHSMGALVSYELAHALVNSYNPAPAYLFVSGHNAPHLPDLESPIHDLPETEFVEKLRVLNGTPEDVLQNVELKEIILPILRADFTLCETYLYQPTPPLNCPICACGGLQDHYLDKNGLDAWRMHTTASFTARMFPGDHFYLNGSRIYLLQVIARELSRFL